MTTSDLKYLCVFYQSIAEADVSDLLTFTEFLQRIQMSQQIQYIRYRQSSAAGHAESSEGLKNRKCINRGVAVAVVEY